MSSVQNQILDALYAAIKPIARFLLRAGISYREFNDICKSAFVEVATADYGIRGRPTNISRVAVMTGLTRKEVKRLREQMGSSGAGRTAKRSAPADVLHSWHTDPRFTGPDGAPAVLDYNGSERSFTRLVKECAGDIPPGAMRTELKRVGAVVENSDGSLRAVRREFVAKGVDERVIDGLNLGLRPLATTIAHNTESSPNNGARFQRVVFSHKLPVDKLAQLQKEVTDRLVRFSESLDNTLTENESLRPEGKAKLVPNVGVGLYFFVEED